MGHTLFCVLSLFLLNTHLYCGHTQDAELTFEPNSTHLFTGESVTFICDMREGNDTDWHYKFNRNGQQIVSFNANNSYSLNLTADLSGVYQCIGRHKGSTYFTKQSNNVTLSVSDNPQLVLTASPLWLSPGASVTLKCEVQHPSAGWRFYWYKAVPDLSDVYIPTDDGLLREMADHSFHNFYSFEPLPGSSNGTEQDSYIVHGQTHTAGYVCRAGRGDPVNYTDYSQPKFVWSGDFHSSVSLTVSPDTVQHFSFATVSLNCEGNSAEWRVGRFTEDSDLSYCSYFTLWGTMIQSTCYVLWSNGAVYWCESGSGEFSNAVNITTDDDIILVSPGHPVTEGDSVTLGCKLRKGKLLSSVAFYKNDKLIQNNNRAELKISAVSKSDEGFYRCDYSGNESPESWMSVKSCSVPVSVIIGLVSGILLVVLLPLVLLCWYKNSKDTCCHRLIQSQRTNQSSATEQTVNQDGNQQQVYSSLLHGDVCIYESISGSGNTESGGQADEYGNVTSQIQLKDLGKRRTHDDPVENFDYKM